MHRITLKLLVMLAVIVAWNIFSQRYLNEKAREEVTIAVKQLQSPGESRKELQERQLDQQVYFIGWLVVGLIGVGLFAEEAKIALTKAKEIADV